MTAPEFAKKWSASGAAESSNAQSFVVDLCELLGVAKPDPSRPDASQNAYVFEKRVTGRNGNTKFIDCYKRGHFILENKQGVSAATGPTDPALSTAHRTRARAQSKRTGHGKRGTATYDRAMLRAKNQADNYARLLPPGEIAGGRPPFLLVCDVGHAISVYADWTRAGGHYQPFPDPANYRILITDLHEAEVRERLRLIWTDPLALDPARRSARVTKQIADQLARLAKSLEGAYASEQTAAFLMRCLFTMFAEDVELLEENAFTKLLAGCREKPAAFRPKVEELWQKMNTGGYSLVLDAKVRRFNGGFFADTSALDLDADQVTLLWEAARADWKAVEPAIFGTLLERALSPRDRHKLGAHYTPRAYVERLVEPTVMEPLRAEWESVQTAAVSERDGGNDAEARRLVEAFLQRLADLRVLDPACGSGNFLYVTLELLKRLEGEVRNLLVDLGGTQGTLALAGATITPENLLGIELNPRAAAIAELVLWIGYLRWQIQTQGTTDLGEPLLRDFHNIENRDAVLAYKGTEPLLDEHGEPVTRWDGVTMKIHPVTGKEVPDEAARTQVLRYVEPQAAQWPAADFIVGNPPFIGDKRMRLTLGDSYTEVLRSVYRSVPASADFVMYWWAKSVQSLDNRTRRIGLITTNSITQTFNQKVVQDELLSKPPKSLVFAIPDHPWVDGSDGADVRVAFTVVGRGLTEGTVMTVASVEDVKGDEKLDQISKRGVIHPDLTVGANVSAANQLQANAGICSFGMRLHGSGFIIDEETALRYGLLKNPTANKYIKPYRNGRDMTYTPRGLYVIDFYGMTAQDSLEKLPEAYQHVVNHVKPERDVNRNKGYREKWWIFGAPRQALREALIGLERYIITVETTKHRVFQFLNVDVLPDNMLVTVADDDAHSLGILSSRIHIVWSLAAGARLGVGNDPRYTKSKILETFPFPTPTEPQKQTIRDLAERLDAHRKRQQAQHPKLTMTGMYNVLEKERSGEALTDKERQIHEQGLVSILRQLHDELDAAVAAAYGWPADLGEQEILQRLVDLNAERAAEEARGLVRWLRPEYQAPEGARTGSQASLELAATDAAPAVVVAEKRRWPKTKPEQVRVLRELAQNTEGTLTGAALAGAFQPKLSKTKLAAAEELLGTLRDLGLLGQD